MSVSHQMGRSETVITMKICVLQLGIWPNQKGSSQIVPYCELIKKAAIISLHEIKRAPQYFIYKLGYIKKATSNQKGTSIISRKIKRAYSISRLNSIEKNWKKGVFWPTDSKNAKTFFWQNYQLCPFDRQLTISCLA